MGSGKSTVGLALSKELNLNFVDADAEIEKQESKSIQDIFNSAGEQEFRKIETEWLIHADLESTVLATGGGMPCFNGNMDKLKLLGTVIYLKPELYAWAQRFNEKERSQRPLLMGLNPNEIKETLTSHLAGRSAIYETAHITIETTNKDVPKIVNEIMKILG